MEPDAPLEFLSRSSLDKAWLNRLRRGYFFFLHPHTSQATVPKDDADLASSNIPSISSSAIPFSNDCLVHPSPVSAVVPLDDIQNISDSDLSIDTMQRAQIVAGQATSKREKRIQNFTRNESIIDSQVYLFLP
jgi:hypothetical protein